MSQDEFHRSAAVDLLTLILCIPFCIWLGWWGILPAFVIGWIINIMASRKQAAPTAEGESHAGD